MSILNKYDWFTVVRNPFTRVVSTVNWAYKRMKENNTGNIYVKYLKNIMSEHKNTDLNTIFNLYINYSLNNLDSKGNHFTPQHLYLNITIIKYENLNYEFNNLMKKYKLNLKITNKSYNKSTVVFKLKDISQDNIILIEKIYKEDFIQFGYPLQSNINNS